MIAPAAVAVGDVQTRVSRHTGTPSIRWPGPPAKAVATVAAPNLLVVSSSMADDLAFDLTRLLLERRGQLVAGERLARHTQN